MSKSLLLVPVLVSLLGGTAFAGQSGEPAYVPTQTLSASLSAEVLPSGTINDGGPDSATTWGLQGWFGWEFVDRIEIGLAPRFISAVAVDGWNVSAREFDLTPKVSLHTRPMLDLDIALALGVGMSWIQLPAGWEDTWSTGALMDFDVTGAYAIGGNLWAIADLGYERGWQTTRTPLTWDRGFYTSTEFSTAYWHTGLGVAYRF
jgi:hypothetical protein